MDLKDESKGLEATEEKLQRKKTKRRFARNSLEERSIAVSHLDEELSF